MEPAVWYISHSKDHGLSLLGPGPDDLNRTRGGDEKTEDHSRTY